MAGDERVDAVQGRNYTLNTALTALEIAERDAARAVRDAERETVEPVPLRSPDEMLSLVFDLEAQRSADAERGREELRRLFKDGQITLLPQRGRYYVARSEVLPLVLVSEPPALSASGPGTDLLVARACNLNFLPSKIRGLRRSGCRSRRPSPSAAEPGRAKQVNSRPALDGYLFSPLYRTRIAIRWTASPDAVEPRSAAE